MFHIRVTSPLLLGPFCLYRDPAPELFRLARQCYHVDRAVCVPSANATSTSQCHVAKCPSAAACHAHSEVNAKTTQWQLLRRKTNPNYNNDDYDNFIWLPPAPKMARVLCWVSALIEPNAAFGRWWSREKRPIQNGERSVLFSTEFQSAVVCVRSTS